MEHYDLLRAISILRDLTDEELRAFSDLLTLREVKSGERIIQEGTVVTALYIVCDGTFHVRRMAQKREMLLNRLAMGAFFGEINLFDPGTATASICAMKSGQLAVVGYDALREFMTANPAAGYKIVSGMMTEMARRLRQTSARLVNAVFWTGGSDAGDSASRG